MSSQLRPLPLGLLGNAIFLMVRVTQIYFILTFVLTQSVEPSVWREDVTKVKLFPGE